MSNSHKRSLVFIIAFLLLTNIGVLAYFLWYKDAGKPASTPPRGMSTSLQTEVGFDDQQVSEYRKLKEKHWATIKPLFEDMRRAKDSLFRMLANTEASDSVISSAADIIAQKQKAIDLQAYSHFKQVRSLCRPDQLVKYDSMVLKLIRKMGRPPRPVDKKEPPKSK